MGSFGWEDRKVRG